MGVMNAVQVYLPHQPLTCPCLRRVRRALLSLTSVRCRRGSRRRDFLHAVDMVEQKAAVEGFAFGVCHEQGLCVAKEGGRSAFLGSQARRADRRQIQHACRCATQPQHNVENLLCTWRSCLPKLRKSLVFDLVVSRAGCPVIRGEKWSATKWIHSTVYGGRPMLIVICRSP